MSDFSEAIRVERQRQADALMDAFREEAEDYPARSIPARARTSDPEPSHEAAALMGTGGRAHAQAQDILRLLREVGRPGLTADAIDCDLFPYSTYAVSAKRLPELWALGLAERTGERRPTRSGVKATVWRAST